MMRMQEFEYSHIRWLKLWGLESGEGEDKGWAGVVYDAEMVGIYDKEGNMVLLNRGDLIPHDQDFTAKWKDKRKVSSSHSPSVLLE
jgi:hypothetical protein